MIGPKYFDNQLVKVQNLEFFRDSIEKNVKDNFLTFSDQMGGVVYGLTLTSGAGTVLNVSAGVAYDNSGERLENFSGISLSAASGSNIVWGTLALSDYNPDPTAPPPYSSFPTYANAQTNINPTNGSGVNVSTFNTIVISQTSGTNSIPLGLVTVSGGNIVNIETQEPYRQPLKLLGILDVETTSIDGAIIGLGTIDSDRFTNPLTADIFLASGTDIFPTVSGSSSLGTPTIPFLDISSKTLNVTNISGLSPITIKSSLDLDSSATIKTLGTELRINPSGQNTFIGDGSYNATPGILYVNNISAWNNTAAPTAPTMGISAGVLNLVLDGNPLGYAFNSTAGALGYRFIATGGNFDVGVSNLFSLTSSGIGTSSIRATNLSVHATGALTLSGTSVSVVSNSITMPSGAVISNLNYGATRQGYDNLIPNGDFSSRIIVSGSPTFSVAASGIYPNDLQNWNLSLGTSGSKTWAGPFFYNGTLDRNETIDGFALPRPLVERFKPLTASGAQYTIEFSFRRDGAGFVSGYNTFFSFGNGGPSTTETARIENGTLSDFYYANNGATLTTGGGAITNGQWYRGAITYSGITATTGAARLYLDNVLKASNNTFPGNFLNFPSIAMGGSIGNLRVGANATSFVNGAIANLVISNYAKPSGTFGSGLTTFDTAEASSSNTIAAYQFRGNLKDSSPNGYDLMNQGEWIYPLTSESMFKDLKDNDWMQLRTLPWTSDTFGVLTDGGVLAATGHDYFVHCSGARSAGGNISLSTSIDGLRPNTEYNLSFWHKDVSAPAGLQYVLTLPTSPSSSASPIASSTLWRRESLTFNTGSASIIGKTLSVVLSGTSASSTPISLCLTGFQLTEGAALLPPIKPKERILVYNQTRQTKVLNSNLEAFLGFNHENIWTRGGKVVVECIWNHLQTPGSSSLHRLIVDNKEVDSTTVRSWSGQNNGPQTLRWEGILPAGLHSFRVVQAADGVNTGIINVDSTFGFPASTFIVKEC